MVIEGLEAEVKFAPPTIRPWVITFEFYPTEPIAQQMELDMKELIAEFVVLKIVVVEPVTENFEEVSLKFKLEVQLRVVPILTSSVATVA